MSALFHLQLSLALFLSSRTLHASFGRKGAWTSLKQCSLQPCKLKKLQTNYATWQLTADNTPKPATTFHLADCTVGCAGIVRDTRRLHSKHILSIWVCALFVSRSHLYFAGSEACQDFCPNCAPKLTETLTHGLMMPRPVPALFNLLFASRCTNDLHAIEEEQKQSVDNKSNTSIDAGQAGKGEHWVVS